MSVHVQPDHFKWDCVNLVIGSGEYEQSSAKEFKEAFNAADNIWVEANYISGSQDMRKTIKEIMDMKIIHQRLCMVTVVCGYAADFKRLLLEAHNQGYTGEWITTGYMGMSVNSFVKYLTPRLENDDSAVQQLLRGRYELTLNEASPNAGAFAPVLFVCKHTHVSSLRKQSSGDPNAHPRTRARAHTHSLTPSGIICLRQKKIQNDVSRAFERAWYTQPSSASMSPDGTRTNCSDAVDASGRYIWRENGVKDGRCCGIDFEQAAQKRRANKCSKTDPICASADLTIYSPFAHDATIALAHGLDTLLHHKGLKPYDITADLLFNATRQSTFEGASGKVSFLSNGDRRADDLAYSVYNYHPTARAFKIVGEMVNGAFVPCKGDCPRTIFSDGSTDIPAARVRDTKFSFVWLVRRFHGNSASFPPLLFLRAWCTGAGSTDPIY